MASVIDPPNSIRFSLTILPTALSPVSPRDGSNNPRELLLEHGQVMVMGRSSRSETKQLQAANHNTFFDCPVISRQHAELAFVLDESSTPQVAIVDRGSRHGTTVNNTKLLHGKSFILGTGDEIKLGDSVQQGSSVHDGLLLKFTRLDSPPEYIEEDAPPAFRGVNLSESEGSDYESEVDSNARIDSDEESANTSPSQCKLDLDLKHPQDKPQRVSVIDLSGIDDAIVSPSYVMSYKNNPSAYSGRNATEPIAITDDELDETVSFFKAQVDQVVSDNGVAGSTEETSSGQSYTRTQVSQRYDAVNHTDNIKDAEWPSIFSHLHHRRPLSPLSPLEPLLSLGTETAPAMNAFNQHLDQMSSMNAMQPFNSAQPTMDVQSPQPSNSDEIDSAADDLAANPAQPSSASDLASEKTGGPYVYEGRVASVDEPVTDDLLSSRWDIKPTDASAEPLHEHPSATNKRKADDSTEADALADSMSASPSFKRPGSSKRRKRCSQVTTKTNKERTVPQRTALQRAASSAAQVAAGALIGAVSTIIFLGSPSSEWLVDWLS